MIAAEFIDLGSRLFTRPGASSHHGWQARAAAHFRVSDRTIRNWVSDRAPIPEGVARELRAMVAIIPPPRGSTDDDDRDDAMRDAIDPALSRVVSEYVRAGWHEAEALTAMLAYSTQELREKCGDAATRATLQAIIMMMDD